MRRQWPGNADNLWNLPFSVIMRTFLTSRIVIAMMEMSKRMGIV